MPSHFATDESERAYAAQARATVRTLPVGLRLADDRLLSTCLFVGFAVAYVFAHQDDTFSDGRFVIGDVERGAWLNRHPLFGVVAQGFHQLVGLVRDVDARWSLALLSALAGAAAVALVFAAARAAGVDRWAAVSGALLMGISPGASFFATTVEEQSLVTLPAAAALLWAARSHRRGLLGRDAVVPLLWLLLIGATHLSGLFLALGASAVAFVGSGRLGMPAHARLATALTVAAGASYLSYPDARPEAVGFTIGAALTSWSLERWFEECALTMAGLWIALPALWRPSGQRTPALIAVAAIAPFLLLVPGYPFDGTRGYYLPLFPLFGLGAALTLHALGRRGLFVAAVLIPLQVGASIADRWSWSHVYEGSEWIPAMRDDVAEGGLVLVAEEWERDSIFTHTRLIPLSPKVGMTRFDLGRPETFQLVAQVIDDLRTAGTPLVILRSLYDSEDPAARLFVQRVVDRYGTPQPAANPEYLRFP